MSQAICELLELDSRMLEFDFELIKSSSSSSCSRILSSRVRVFEYPTQTSCEHNLALLFYL